MKNKKEILIITLFSLSIIICVVLLFRTAKLSAALEELQEESSDVVKESKQIVAEDIVVPSSEAETEQSERMAWSPRRDASYKVFFGEWEIVEIVPGWNSPLMAEEDLNEFIGTRLFYDVRHFKIDGEEISDNVFYDIAIVPVEKYDLYFRNIPMAYKDIYDIVPQDQDCFIHIYVTYEGYDYLPVGKSFFIKDPDTIIIETEVNDCFYYLKCERIAHLENYENKIDPV